MATRSIFSPRASATRSDSPTSGGSTPGGSPLDGSPLDCSAPDAAIGVMDRLLEDALVEGASDLHLDPRADGIAVRVRVDGALRTTEHLPKALGPRLVGRCKALADLLVYREDLPQEGRLEHAGRDVRVATYPTLHGERVALRFEAHDGAPRSLRELGLPDDILRAVREAIEQPDGVLFLTGPSGSGKTTTLYSCLHHLVGLENERTIVTVEDPIERRIDGVTQTETSEPAGLGFARALRSLLRQDPDVLLIGEVRDRETASTALEAGLTGHLVASTIHAGSAPEVFARLLEMGVEPFVLTTTVRGVLAQRLLRKSCSTCDAAGCVDCANTGYRGRLLLAEWLPMNDALRRSVLARHDATEIAHAVREGDGQPSNTSTLSGLRDAAARLVADGLTTDFEVRRVLGTRD